MVTSISFNSDRYLFLDIDGVVNTLMIYSEPIKGRKMIEKDGFYFDMCHPEDKRVSNEFAIRWLNKVCLEYNLKIVLTSTWLIGHKIKDIEKCLRNSGLDDRIDVYGGTYSGKFDSRGIQIEDWLLGNGYSIDDTVFVILDDDADMIGFTRDLTPYLVQCNTYNGFTINEYSKSCELLDKLINEREVHLYGKAEE